MLPIRLSFMVAMVAAMMLSKSSAESVSELGTSELGTQIRQAMMEMREEMKQGILEIKSEINTEVTKLVKQIGERITKEVKSEISTQVIRLTNQIGDMDKKMTNEVKNQVGALVKQLGDMDRRMTAKSNEVKSRVNSQISRLALALSGKNIPVVKTPSAVHTNNKNRNCVSRKNCVWFADQCWCKTTVKGTPGYKACGYLTYNNPGKYYTLDSSGRPKDLLTALGLKPHPSCSNDNCALDCGRNYCYQGLCHGKNAADKSCYTDRQSWEHNATCCTNIVRCTNFE